MSKHSHRFVETYKGLVGFGADRQTDEKTVTYYLQKLSDDEMMGVLMPRLDDTELAALFDTVSQLLQKHLTEGEYHRLFLKEDREHRH